MTESQSSWKNVDGAIIERPRSVTRHPLLDRIYQRHDELIGEFTTGQCLEIAFGRHPHPAADVGVEAYPENNNLVENIDAITADARSLPFDNNSFNTIIGRRFLHHVPEIDRIKMLDEANRVLSDNGTLILLEGTPGLYRRLTKGVAFKLGILGEDNDEYGHLDSKELIDTVQQADFEIIESQPLGSPLMPFCILKKNWTKQLISLHERAQFVRWWTFIISKPK